MDCCTGLGYMESLCVGGMTKSVYLGKEKEEEMKGTKFSRMIE